MHRLWFALRAYWTENKDAELAPLPSMWPLPAFILAVLIWVIATSENSVSWQLWAGVAVHVALLVWLLWLRKRYPRG